MSLSSPQRIVLGVDPGFDRTGVAVLSWNMKPSVLYSACIETSREDERSARLRTVRKEVENVIQKWHPEMLVLETLFFSTNKKTAVGVAEARGVIREVGESLSLTLIEVSPQEVKLAATGNGRSTKRDVIRMIPHLVENAPRKAVDDEYDAIAVALAGGAKVRFPQREKGGLAENY